MPVALRSRARPWACWRCFARISARTFGDRDARLADILARKAVGIIESSYDALSGLYTRPAFEQRVRARRRRHEAARRHWTALYIDVDQLHVINDNFGMHVGDTVLGQLGELIRAPAAARRVRQRASPATASRCCCRPNWMMRRALPNRLREGVEMLGTMHGESRLHVSISVGVAPLDTAAGELMHSLAAAETACKAAKDRGRNRVEVYQPNDVSLVRRFADINIAGQLREAIDAGRLRLDAQLILPFAGADSARPHFELLLRMIDDDGRTIGPDRFMSAAQSLPAHAGDRPLGLQQDHRDAQAPRGAARRPGDRRSPSTSPASRSTMRTSRTSCSSGSLNSGIDPELFCFELTENATIQTLRARKR